MANDDDQTFMQQAEEQGWGPESKLPAGTATATLAPEKFEGADSSASSNGGEDALAGRK